MDKYHDILNLMRSGSYQSAVEELNQIGDYRTKAGIKLTLISRDYAEGELTLGPDYDSDLDRGLLFTMADSVAGIAACSRGIPYVTLSSTINFIKAVSSGKVTCKAVPRQVEEGISVFEASIMDEDDSTVAVGIFTFSPAPDKH